MELSFIGVGEVKTLEKYTELDRLWSYLIMAFASFFEPIGVVLLWMLIFVFADMLAGMYASLKEGKNLESHKMQKTIIKVITYSTSVILLHGLDMYFITFIDCGLAKIGATIICGIELYSILENFYRATNNEVFRVLTTFTLKKIKESTGVDLHDGTSH